MSYLEYNLSLIQGIFLTQELNWGLLHRRRILYQLSYQGNPSMKHFDQIYLKYCHKHARNMKINKILILYIVPLKLKVYCTLKAYLNLD